LRMRDGVLERGAADAERVRRELHTRAVEDPHQPGEALPLLTEAAVFGDEAVFEVELARGKAAAAHLRQSLAAAEPVVAVLDDERGDALGARARSDRREDDGAVGDVCIPDELLVPV